MRSVPLAAGALAAFLLFPTVVRAQEPVPVGERTAPPPQPVPVPVREPSAPIAVALAVERKRLETDVSLQTWLSTKTTERVEAVVPLSAGTSLFVFRSGPGVRPPTYSVFHAAEALSADGFEARLALHKDRTFLGVHILGPSAYLLVYADER
jgi:hypothetical protein